MSDSPIIDGFEHIELIGSGGFADVHLYRQRMPSRTVAVKILRSAELTDAVKRQFIVEANVMARLSNHPGIATIYTAGITSDDRPYLVMEYCPGGSLAERYRKAPLPIAEAVSIGVRMAAALESAHRVGVVHRDIKPANILVTEYGSPVLTDFGIALGHEAALESTMLQNLSNQGSTRDGSGLAYSVPWAAPEVLLESDDNDAVADVYSLAATLRTLVEGVSPFELPAGNNSFLAMSRRVELGEASSWSRVGVPDRLREVLDRGMSVERASRYQTALELAFALQSVEAAESLRSTHIELLGATGEPPVIRDAQDATPGDAELGRTILRARVHPSGHSSNPADVGVESDGRVEELHTIPDVQASRTLQDETQKRPSSQEEDLKRASQLPRRAWRPSRAVVAVALSVILVALGSVGFSLWQSSQNTAPFCPGSPVDNRAVPLALTDEQQQLLLPEGVWLVCGFSQPLEDQFVASSESGYHVLVLQGYSTNFVEMSRLATLLAPDFPCDEDPELAETFDVTRVWSCEDRIDGELNSISVYDIGGPAPDTFPEVPSDLSTSVVVVLRISAGLDAWS